MPETGHVVSGFAEVNGTSLYYEIAGSGEPVVFIHGFTLDTRMWDDQFLNFARHYRVLRYDLRGFGKSSLPTDEPYGHEADLKALLEFVGIAQAHLIGLSRGGMVAINFALTYSESVRTLTCVDGFFAGCQWSDGWDTRMDMIWEIAREQGISAVKQSWLDHPMFQATREKPLVNVRLEQIVADYSGWHFVNQNPSATVLPIAAERLHQINVPMLILVGERDLPDFHAIADEMQRQVPDARKVVLPDAGHMANMDNPNAFNDAVLGFLAGA